MKPLVVIALALLVGGCIPIIKSKGYLAASRHNVPAELPSLVEAGRTTMEDVVLAFGEPDVVADDESWMSFASSYSQGGGGAVLLVGGGGTAGAIGGTHEQRLYRRLIVRFDAAGTVTAARIDGTSCAHDEIIFGQSAGSGPACFDVGSLDLVAADLARAFESAGSTGVVPFARAEWLPTHQRGTLVVSDAEVIFVPTQGGKPSEEAGIHIALADVERVDLRVPFFHGDAPGRYQAILRRRDTGIATFILLDSNGVDDVMRTRDAARLIAQRLQAARPPPAEH